MSLSYLLLFVASLVLLAKQSTARSYEVPEKVYYDLDMSESLFEKFVSQRQKQYTSEEFDYRHRVFQANLKTINELNAKHELTTFGLTKFSDWTSEEFMKMSSCMHGSRAAELMEVPDIEAPDNLDWREKHLVTAVKDQGNCGSCYIFGATGEIEGQYAKVHKELVSLSEQYPLDCGPFTCNGAYPINVTQWLSNTPGDLKGKDYPYHAEKNKCQANDKTAVAKVLGGTEFSVSTSEDLKKVLASHGPLAIGLFAGLEFQFYGGGVLEEADCDGFDNNHAVTLVGYGNKPVNHWIIKNSWGQIWGENGYIRLAMDHCGVGSDIMKSKVG